MSRVTAYLWARSDSTFAAAVDQAELDACEIVEDALFNKAKDGHLTAIIFYLTNRVPDRWKDRRAVKQEVHVTSADDMSPDQIKRKIEEALKPPPP